jgi:hypothetical protein
MSSFYNRLGSLGILLSFRRWTLRGGKFISAVTRSVEGRRRGSSLWLAHDLSMAAVDDKVCYLK